MRVVDCMSVTASSSSCSSSLPSSLPDLNREQPRAVFSAGPRPRAATSSVPYQTSTASSHVQCSRTAFPAVPRPRAATCSFLPGPKREQPRPVFASLNRNSHVQCSWPDLNHEQPRAVFPARRRLRAATSSVPCRTATSEHICQKACQKLCQQEVRNAGVMFS